MKTTATRSALLGLALAAGLTAKENTALKSGDEAASPPVELKDESAKKDENAKGGDSAESKDREDSAEAKNGGKESEEKPAKDKPADEKDAKMKAEQERLALQNALADERLKRETARMRAEIARLKTKTELMQAKLAHAAAERRAAEEEKNVEMEREKERLTREAEIAEARAKSLGFQLKAAQAESGIEVGRLKSQIERMEMAEKRKTYADAEPEYLENPLREDGTLVISDRRIMLNGPITTSTADEVTDRIHYFNNQDPDRPIFIVIDECPGGSVMAGYRILKSMEASDASIHVAVKSFAASMAAAITTLAEESYAYPNAVILHHQISSTVMGRMNLTQQKEFVEETKRWWNRFGTPIAEKMGITKEEFVKKMYEHSSSGDWTEFAAEAKELNWVRHIVTGMEESSFRRDPDARAEENSGSKRASGTPGVLEPTLDEDGRPVMYLPRPNPKDVYFLYNPDNYYRLR